MLTEQQKKCLSTRSFSVMCGALFGALIFCLIYGVDILNVTKDGWLFNYNDLTQHYLGWEFFRKSDWHFPLGLMDGVIENQLLSIIFTDSIPCMAILCKVFSPLLPPTFQYFGIWGLLCFTLQGALGTLLVAKYVRQPVLRILGGVCFCFFSALFRRMYIHTALAAQWILLLGMVLWLYRPYAGKNKKVLAAWCALLAFSVSVHMYFMPMLACMLFFSCLQEGWTTGQWKPVLVRFLLPIFCAAANLWLLGGFYGNSQLLESGIGEYSSNLNAFFNSWGVGNGKIFPQLPLALSGQGEGVAYLGAGILLLLFFCAAAAVVLLLKEHSLPFGRAHYKGILCAAGAGAVLWIYATFPIVTLNDQVLFTVPLPQKLLNMMGLFRATGRFIWPVAYGLILLAIFGLCRVLKKQRTALAALVLGAVIALQIWDCYGLLKDTHIRFADANDSGVAVAVDSTGWNRVMQGKTRMVYLSLEDVNGPDLLLSLYLGMDKTFALSQLCYENGLTENNFYLGRRDQNAIRESQQQDWEQIERGAARADTIYLFTQLPCTLMEQNLLYFYQMNDLTFGLKEPLTSLPDGCRLLQWPKDIAYQNFWKKMNVQNGLLEAEKAEIEPGGVLYGPYLTFPAGSYRVTICGEGLTSATVFPAKAGQLPYEAGKTDDTEIQYVFSLTEKTNSGVELVTQNTGTENVIIQDIRVECVK